MKINVTKQMFEQAVRVARNAKDTIFNVLLSRIEESADELSRILLGEAGTRAFESGSNEELCKAVVTWCCLDAFIREMRGLDVVLTNTGFGVVSTNDTAPASKQRVDAVEGELRVQRLCVRDRIIFQLYKVEGWVNSPQRKTQVPTLFAYSLMADLAGIARPKEEDWSDAQASITEADLYLREHIGNEYMDELMQQLCSNSVTDADQVIICKCRRFIGMKIKGDHAGMLATYRDIINTMEHDIEAYPTYRDSEAYSLNHSKPYENTKDSTTFQFCG